MLAHYVECHRAEIPLEQLQILISAMQTIDDSKSVVLNGNSEFVKVSVKDLKALKASINGDCYQGEDWELETIDKMLKNI